jgi:Flp pilus assembly pilin Flp
MKTLAVALFNDEAGFVVSAELALIASVCVLAMVVGLSEVANSITQELEDVASAFGAMNQTYRYQGLVGHSGASGGGAFTDGYDYCDSANDIIGVAPAAEGRGHHDNY